MSFAHDIFFEWAFLHLLFDRGEAWLEEIKAVGEPPVLGRVVELLSQARLGDGAAWEADLTRLENAALRPQWTRAWLLAPFGTPGFWDAAALFTDSVLKENGRRLAKLAVWLQAEKTRANPLVLEGKIDIGRLSRLEVIRTADSLAWPSDVAAWNRFLSWSLHTVAQFPVEVIPDLVSAFEVWQYMLADVPNDVSRGIFDAALRWLEDIEDRQHAEEFRFDRGPWDGLRGELDELEQRLRNLVLRAARIEQPKVRAYLERVGRRPHLRRDAYSHIVAFTRTLAFHHAKEVVDLTLAEVKGDLPATIAARDDDGDFAGFGGISDHRLRELSISDSGHAFFPPSPLREPFASLFESAPAEAQALVRELTNHAITAWRQVFELDPRTRATPLPLTLAFPWGRQEFWGTQQTYMWTRGHLAPHTVACGLMALEQWAFSELDRGRAVGEVIEDVLRGQDSCAVLSIAVILAIGRRSLSAVTLPIATSQMLWKWDIARQVSDRTSGANLSGFMKPSDLPHAEAVHSANRRPERQFDIRFLANLFVIAADAPLREAAQAAIQAFPDNLPIGFAEEMADAAHMADLRRTAEIWSEIGKPENYAVRPAPDGSGTLIELQSPTAGDPDVVAALERQKRMHNQLELLNWVTQSLERGRLSEALGLAEAVTRARALDRPGLFDIPHETAEPDAMDQGAVAGVAATALRCEGPLDPELVSWAADVIGRAMHVRENADRPVFAGAKLIHDPRLYAVSGVEGLIGRGLDVAVATHALLRLAGHPFEEVSATAIGVALGLWERDPKLAWAVLNLGIRVSTASRDALPSAYGYDHGTEPGRMDAAIEAAIDEYAQADPRVSLEPVPAAWVFARIPEAEGIGWRRRGSDEPIWRDPDKFLRWDFLPKVLARIPIRAAMADAERRPAFVSFCLDLLEWTNERLNPSWRDADADRRDRRSTDLIEWNRSFMWFLAEAALFLEPAEVEQRILEPVFAHDDETAAALLHPLVDGLAGKGVVDPPQIDGNALRYMEACLGRILRDRMWAQARWRDGGISGYDIPEIVRIFCFVAVEFAGTAARFSNRDWQEIDRVLPLVDGLVRAVGDIPHVIGSFLTLCERSLANYPVGLFVEQIGAVLGLQDGTPAGWRGTTIPARIASLIYAFAEKSLPLEGTLAQAMLRILDRLVDMGDRRSAALQASEIFKEVRF